MTKCFIVRSNATAGVPVQVVVPSDAHMKDLVGEWPCSCTLQQQHM